MKPEYEKLQTHTYWSVKYAGKDYTIEEIYYENLETREFTVYNEDGQEIKGEIAEYLIGEM